MATRSRRKPQALNLGVTRPRTAARRGNGRKRNAVDAKADVDIFDQVYCICQQPWSAEDSDMIQCDRCDDWFHPECVGLSSLEDISEDDPYYCPRCKSGDGPEVDTSSSSNEDYPMSATEPPSSASSLPKRSKALNHLSHSMDADSRASPAGSMTDFAERSMRNLALSPTPFVGQQSTSLPFDPAVEALVRLRSPSTSLKATSALAVSTAASDSSNSRRRSNSATSRSTVMKKTPSSARNITGKAKKGFDTKTRHQAKAQSLVDQLSTSAPSMSGLSQRRDSSGSEGARADPATKRLFHNERERQRRSTIRTLFEALRKSVPAIESQEGTSDRQILVEATREAETLKAESRSIDEELLKLKMENVRLRMECSIDSEQTETQAPQLLNLLGETAELMAMKEELAKPVPSSPLKLAPTIERGPDASSSVGSQGGDLIQLLMVAEQERCELGAGQ
eukprot:TRINITY_DN11053_c0_g1_i1.p1 TRINITY_DN11053_c0_g1~~TRINITY_DN11053_c0_g1_i1.p1  ORF type:complete len:452 (+),score=102.59 TRINITY_DN11053_c0_g1_i1:469-1824(+)